ncbi:MAG: hypothetical protein L0H92_11975, partial [Lactococcus lactis]|nr:hypothetical protein [Lactococcus lactis]
TLLRMQRKAHLLFLPASRRVRGEFEREHPLIYGVKLTQLAGLGSAHGFIRVGYKFENQGARERILRPYYDPPFKCRVPILVKNGLQAFNINGYRVLNLGEFSASF